MKRRKFIKDTAAGAAAFTIIPASVLGKNGAVPPSDRINLGYIGTGKQARGLQKYFTEQTKESVTVAACDVDSQKLDWFKELAGEANKERGTSANVFTTKDYREILQRDDVDGVVIATPDHWHAQIAVDAAKAGKDIYCEKPLALTVAEGRAMVNATRKYDRVFQTGNMQRSWRDFRHAVELVRNGYIGEVKTINVGVGDPVQACDLPSMEAPPHLDWNMWVGPTLYRGYNPVLSPPVEEDIFPKWRRYRGFGGGVVTDWGAHMFDIGQWALDMDTSGPSVFIPPKAGEKRGLKMIYDNGVVMNHVDLPIGYAVEIIGTNGRIEVSRNLLKTYPDEKLAKMELKDKKESVYFSDNHYQDWLDAMKNRNRPVSDVETGHRTASLANIANIAYQLEQPLQWDPEEETFIGDPNANLMLTRAYRGEWDFNNY